MSEPLFPPQLQASGAAAAAPSRFASVRKPAEPHVDAAVAQALWHPLRTIDVVLASPERVGANVEQRVALWRLALVFLACGALYALPYGCVLGSDSWWRVIALYLGSTLICLPSLHIFASYLGQRVALAQVLVLALTIPAVAAVFTLGFAPILCFLRETMSPQGGEISWRALSSSLLGIALGAGIVQLWRCLYAARLFASGLLLPLVLLVWHGVFLYVFVRMFRVLDL
jgi:hypothetical protein